MFICKNSKECEILEKYFKELLKYLEDAEDLNAEISFNDEGEVWVQVDNMNYVTLIKAPSVRVDGGALRVTIKDINYLIENK